MVFAYIDPGTGSIILQALIGIALGAAVAAKLFWHRILQFFGVKSKETSLLDEENEEN